MPIFFGAVCPDKDRAVGLVLPEIGMVCMQKHFEFWTVVVMPGMPLPARPVPSASYALESG